TPPPDPTPVPEPDDVTEVYPDEVATLHDVGREFESELLSVEDRVVLSETPSDEADSFYLEADESQGTRVQLPAVLSFSSQPRRPAEDEDFHYGDRIDGRYEVAQVLIGSMGIVYLCYDHDERQAVAIKTFQSKFLTNE